MGQSLYEKYGGFAGINGVVQTFYDRVLDDDTLDLYFDAIEMPRLIDHQTKFLCKVLGGPDNYTGRSLQKAHAKLNVTSEAFASVAAHLASALEEAGVEPGDIEAILSVVAGTKAEIVSARG